MNNKLLNEVLSLSQKVILKWVEEGVEVKEASDSVLEVVKEYMNPNNPNVKDVKECISGLKLLLKQNKWIKEMKCYR